MPRKAAVLAMDPKELTLGTDGSLVFDLPLTAEDALFPHTVTILGEHEGNLFASYHAAVISYLPGLYSVVRKELRRVNDEGIDPAVHAAWKAMVSSESVGDDPGVTEEPHYGFLD